MGGQVDLNCGVSHKEVSGESVSIETSDKTFVGWKQK